MDRGLSWDVGLGVLKLKIYWFPSIQWNLPYAFRGESSHSYLVEVCILCELPWGGPGAPVELWASSPISPHPPAKWDFGAGNQKQGHSPRPLSLMNLFTRLPLASCCSLWETQRCTPSGADPPPPLETNRGFLGILGPVCQIPSDLPS